jgi:DNA-binding NtrC family response regulator
MTHVLDQPILELSSNDSPSLGFEISHKPSPRKGEALSTGARILVVDDNHTIADPLAFVLWFEGYTARAVHSGLEAIAVAEQFKPELLISDVIMPHLSGTETASRVCLILPKCKVILFSGDIEGKRIAQHARQDGLHFEFLEKPLHPQKLVSQINLLLPKGT